MLNYENVFPNNKLSHAPTLVVIRPMEKVGDTFLKSCLFVPPPKKTPLLKKLKKIRMNLIFCKLKKLKKHECKFLQALIA